MPVLGSFRCSPTHRIAAFIVAFMHDHDLKNLMIDEEKHEENIIVKKERVCVSKPKTS